MKFAQRVRSLALRERVGVRERSGARRHFIVRGGSARPIIVSQYGRAPFGPRVPRHQADRPQDRPLLRLVSLDRLFPRAPCGSCATRLPEAPRGSPCARSLRWGPWNARARTTSPREAGFRKVWGSSGPPMRTSSARETNRWKQCRAGKPRTQESLWRQPLPHCDGDHIIATRTVRNRPCRAFPEPMDSSRGCRWRGRCQGS